MGLIRMVVYVGIIGGLFAYSQTKDSLENISFPDAELPLSITSNNLMKSSGLSDHYASLKNSGLLDDAPDIRGSVNDVVMKAGNIDIQKVIQDAVDELDSSSRKSSK